MRIAHVVTYISADGAFGGPVSVALEQAEELAARGHDVEIIAGWDGTGDVHVPGVRVSLFRVARVGRGFSGTISARLFAYFWKRASTYDVVHVHAGRDLITLPVALAALRKKVPLFLQTHGMIVPDSRLSARLVDAVATRRAVRGSAVAFALTDAEERALSTLGRADDRVTTRIANGIKAAPPARPPQSTPPVVLFLARLHPRKRVMTFAAVSRLLIESGVDATFRVVGPDEGDGIELAQFIDRHRLQSAMSYAGAVGRADAQRDLSEASVYVLPSVGEIFPMTVLEAMSVGTPVVVTSDCGIANELHARSAAVVTEGSVPALAAAVRRLLEDADFRLTIIDAAHAAVRDWLSIEAVVDELEHAYLDVHRGV